MTTNGLECLECQRCMKFAPGRKKPYPCDDGYKPPPFQGLLQMLKALFTPTRWRKLRGRMKPGTYERRKVIIPKPERAGRGKGLSAWQKVKMEAESSPYTLDSTPPRITTAVTLGPDALARNFFPDLEPPTVSLTEEDALRLTIKDQERKLRNMYRSQLKKSPRRHGK